MKRAIFYTTAVLFIVLATSCKKENLIEEYYMQAVDLLNQKEYNKALTKLDHCNLLDEDFAMAYLQKAIIYKRLELYGKSLTNINRFLTYDTLLAVGYTERGLLRVNLHDYHTALADCKNAVVADNGYYKAYYCSGRALIGAQKYSDALTHLSTSIQLKDDYGKAYYYRGLLHEGMNENNAACQDFTSAAKLGELRALKNIDEVCTGPEVVEKVVVEVVEKEVVKVVEKEVVVEKPLEVEKEVAKEVAPASQKPVYHAPDKLFEVHSYFANFDITENQAIDWGENPASPVDLYVMIRELDENYFYVGFYDDGKKVYDGKYTFSNLDNGFLYKRTDIPQHEIIRVNNALKDCAAGKIATDRTNLELVNYTRARGVKVVF